MRRRLFTLALVCLSTALVTVSVVSSARAADTNPKGPTCAQQVSAYVRTNPYHVRLRVDATNPFREAILDLAGGCRLVVQAEFTPTGGHTVRQPGTTSTVTAYPYPPAPDGPAGLDPQCRLKSYAHDPIHLETWVTELFQNWDNYAPCCAALVNPWAQQNVATDPFFVVTSNTVSDTWVVFPEQVQATGHAAFHSDAGPTDDGVDHWIRAWSDGCIADGTFFGPAPAQGIGGHFHRDPVVFTQ